MANTFKLEIYTPYGKYLEQDVLFLNVQGSEFNLGILPNHSPLITTLKISNMKVKGIDKDINYAIGGGVLHVQKEKTVLLLDSIESKDEIDIERALSAKARAEERLANKNDIPGIDVKRAEMSLLRALNRIKVSQGN